MVADFISKINAVKASDIEKAKKVPNMDPLMCVALQSEYEIMKRITNHSVIVKLPEGGACYADFDHRGFWILEDINGVIPRREDLV